MATFLKGGFLQFTNQQLREGNSAHNLSAAEDTLATAAAECQQHSERRARHKRALTLPAHFKESQ